MSNKQNKSVVILDLSVLPRRPGPLVIEKFLTRSLNLRLEEMLSVQLSTSSSFVYIKCINSEVANKLAEKNLKCSIKCGKEETPIPVFIDDDLKEIRLHDLPFDIADEAILKVMCQYGTVQTITSERWRKFFGGLPNGVRLLRIKLEHPIPKRLNIDGCVCIVTYKGQPTRLNQSNASKKTQSKIKNKEKNSINNKTNQSNSNKTTNLVPSSSGNNNNNNNNNNKSNETNQPKGTNNGSNEDNDGFQVVLSKSERKNLKRASVEHTQEDLPNPKRLEVADDILKAVTKKKDFYFEKWIMIQGEDDENAEEEYYSKWRKYQKMENDMYKSAKQKSETK